MNFQTTPNRTVNRFGISVIADSNGIISTDNIEMIELLKEGYKFPEVKAEIETTEVEEISTEVEVNAETRRGRKAK